MLKRRDNKTKRRPQEDKQDNNKEEWYRKDYRTTMYIKTFTFAQIKTLARLYKLAVTCMKLFSLDLFAG